MIPHHSSVRSCSLDRPSLCGKFWCQCEKQLRSQSIPASPGTWSPWFILASLYFASFCCPCFQEHLLGQMPPVVLAFGNTAIYYNACCSSDHPAKLLAGQPHPVLQACPLHESPTPVSPPLPGEEHTVTHPVPSPHSVFFFFISRCFCSSLHSDVGWRPLDLFLASRLFS